MADPGLLAKLNDPAFYANPYGVYKTMRDTDRVLLTPLRGGSWFITGYAEVAAGLKCEQFSNARAGAFMTMLPAEVRDEFKPLAATLSKWALFLDAPRHTYVRKLMARAFSQISQETHRLRIERVVQQLLDTAAERGEMDVIKDFAYPLPLMVIVEMLGVPMEKKSDFARWSDDIGTLLGGAAPTLEQARKTQRSVVEMTELLRGILAERRTDPREDILTTLVQAEEDGDKLDEDEILAQCVLLLFAGHETTRNLIGNGLNALLENPDELARLRRDPSLVKLGIEEMLRYDSPIQMLSRLVKDDVEFAGRQIKKGQYAMLFIGAGNRDPSDFTDPDRLDLSRKEKPHLSFAPGPHLCIGAQIGRLEAQIAFNALLDRFSHIQHAGDKPKYGMNLVLRGLGSFPVQVSSRAHAQV
jgi:cytochrome P450